MHSNLQKAIARQIFTFLVLIFSLQISKSQCNQKYNWTVWPNFQNVTSATGTVVFNGQPIDVTLSSNFEFGSTGSIFDYSLFNGFGSPIPNTTVPETTWSFGIGGVTSMCFSETVSNPVLLLASLGAPGRSVIIQFSVPYKVLYDAGGMQYINDSTIIGTEGNAVLLFPGNFNCVSIYSSTYEYYTNLTWGLNPPLFAVNIAGNPQGCGRVTLTASGGVSYSWSGGEYPNSATNTFDSTGRYLLTVKDSNGCTVLTSEEVVLTKNTFASENQSICEGESYLGHTASGNYIDTLETAYGCDSIITLNLQVKPRSFSKLIETICQGQTYEGYDKSGIYVDTFKNGAASGCDSIRTLNLIVKTAVEISLDTTICYGKSYILPSGTYVTISGKYLDTLKNSIGCDSLITNLYLTIDSLFPINNNISFCENGTDTISPGNEFNSYLWNTGAHTPSIIITEKGIYSVKVTDQIGCSFYDTFSTNIYLIPSLTLPKDIVLCSGQPKILDAGPGYNSYLWSTGSTDESVSITSRGTYWVTVKDVHECLGSDTTIINDVEQPPSGFLIADITKCSYSSILLNPNNTFSSYIWSTGSTKKSIVVANPGVYWLDVIDGNDCKGSDTTVIKDSACKEFVYIPSAFTPNGDGIDDFFKPLITGVPLQYIFMIFNRWGQKVFETSVPGEGWNGSVNGLPQQTGAYVWEITIQLSGEKLEKKNGTIVLIR